MASVHRGLGHVMELEKPSLQKNSKRAGPVLTGKILEEFALLPEMLTHDFRGLCFLHAPPYLVSCQVSDWGGQLMPMSSFSCTLSYHQ